MAASAESMVNNVMPLLPVSITDPSDKDCPLKSMQLNDCKAGMQGLDKDYINHIIYQTSKGSKYFENERRKEEKMQQKIHEQENRRKRITTADLEIGAIEADAVMLQLTSGRDLSQAIVHVDMDAFFAAVEMRDDISLLNKPMAVGSLGMLSTSNYEARKFGVRAAMPGFIAKKLCPDLIIVPPRFHRYQEFSRQVRAILLCYDPLLYHVSLDEAYVNITDHLSRRQSMSVERRTVLKRCQTPADPCFCRCDLNLTMTSHDSLPVVQNLGSQEVECFQESKLTNIYPACSDEQRNGQIDGSFVNDDFSTEGHILDEFVRCRRVSVSNSSCSIENEVAYGSNVSSNCSTSATSMRCFSAGDRCSVCHKVIPPFEVVVFGIDVESAVQEMRCRIEQRTCLTASAGIASNMMLSKVCSDIEKPNGQYFLRNTMEYVNEFTDQLPIRKIPGIGRVTEQLLSALDISTCGDLMRHRALLYHLYSPISFSYFMRVACGIGSIHVASARQEERKSISTEQTFRELSRPEDLYVKCQELCKNLAGDLIKERLIGKTLSLKLKTVDFLVRTRSQTLSHYTNALAIISAAVAGILKVEIQAHSTKPLLLRLMGVRMSNLVQGGVNFCKQKYSITAFLEKTPHTESGLSRREPDMPSLSPSMPVTKQVTENTTMLPYNYLTDVKLNTYSIYSETNCNCSDNGNVTKSTSDTAVRVNLQPASLDIPCQPEDGENYNRVLMSSSNTSRDVWCAGNDVWEVTDAENNGALPITAEAFTQPATPSLRVASDLLTAWRRTSGIMAESDCNDPLVETSFVEAQQDTADNCDTAGDIDGNRCDNGEPYTTVTVKTASLWEDIDTSKRTVVTGECETSTRPANGGTSDTGFPAGCPRHSVQVSCVTTGHDLHDFSQVGGSYTDTTNCRDSAHVCRQKALLDSLQCPVFDGEVYNCPVCCKYVECVTLHMLNVHIDMCLQYKSRFLLNKKQLHVSDETMASSCDVGVTPGNKSMRNVEGSEKFLCLDEKFLTNGPSTQQYCFSETDMSSFISEGHSSMTPPINSCSDSSAKNSCEPCSCVMTNTGCAMGVGGNRVKYVGAPVTDCMICPLCGAKRDDWTLKNMNQHVDECLNRRVISQILREQEGTERQAKRRTASQVNSHLRSRKKTKKAAYCKLNSSILSFIKR